MSLIIEKSKGGWWFSYLNSLAAKRQGSSGEHAFSPWPMIKFLLEYFE